MCDNNTFIRLLAAAQSAQVPQPTAAATTRTNGQTTPSAAAATKMPADMMMWQQLITAQAQAQMMAAYQQQLQQQQHGLGEIFRQLGEMTKKKESKQPPPPAAATATIKEGAELKLEIGEVPKPVKTPAAAPVTNNALEQAMWRMLAAQMLQQQNALTKTTNGYKKEPSNGVLDLSHKHAKAEPCTSTEGTETTSSTPHEGQEHGKKRAPPSEGAARLPIQLGWRRQTCIRALAASGIRGDVVYYGPCGKKLSSYAEVIRYLMKNPCPAITRDNFSFSSKLMIGEFIYPKEATDGEKIITKLTEEEVTELINHLVSQKPLPKVVERKHKEPVRPRSATPEDINDLYDLSENGKAHDEEDKQKWSREPMDDLLLTEIRPLPELTRIPNLRLSGEGVADALMVFEFCHNFADVLSMKRESLPTLEEMVAGLEGDAHHAEKALDLTRSLFGLILEYPGLPGGKKGHTVLGQSLADIGMCRENYTELMIMFLSSRCPQGKSLANLMENRTFEQLNGEEKASILAYFCNELVCCRNIVREIDNNLEEIGKLKGERWLRDGKARALRAQQKRKKKEEKIHHEEEGENENSDSDGSRVGSPVPHANNKKFTPGLGQVEILTEEEEAMTVTELDQAITDLKLESDGLKDQINGLNNRVRSFPFGWDRYHRQYWQLPHVSTVLVESMESAGLNNPACNVAECCSKDPRPYPNPEPKTFMDPDVFTVVEDLIDEVVLAKIAPEKRKRKKCRRIENSCKRGWWLVTGREQLEAVKSSLHGRGIRERCLHRLLCKNWFMKDVRCTSMSLYPLEEVMADDVTCYELNRVRDAISSLEHRIADSMLGIPGWTPSPPTYPTEDPTQWDYTHLADEPAQDLPGLGQRLLHLETVVERRYLRQSFYSGAIPTVAQVLGITKSEAKEEEEHKDEEMEDEEKEKMDETDEAKVDMMTTWRVYIQEAIRPSQLMLAVQCLESSIAWERSISEACCQICRTSGQPDDLLLCDGCQMGYHMSCFKPKLVSVPEGNYYCPRCREHAGGKPICVLCQKEGAPIYPCKKCYNFLHLECTGQHTPDRPSDYFCPACEPKNFERKVILRGESEERGEVEEVAEAEIKDFRRGTKRKAEPLAPVVFPVQMNLDLCRSMLDELEQQPSVGPFLEPVDLKLVPGYREIIPNPIDISTIRNKVDSECYDAPDEFAADLELMFTNCRTFNEDDSPVGVAGHTLQKFFTKRWRQIKYNYSKRLRRLRPN